MRAELDSTTYHRFEDWELDFVSCNLHESDTELAERLGRTRGAVYNMRIELDRMTHGGKVKSRNRPFAA